MQFSLPCYRHCPCGGYQNLFNGWSVVMETSAYLITWLHMTFCNLYLTCLGSLYPVDHSVLQFFSCQPSLVSSLHRAISSQESLSISPSTHLKLNPKSPPSPHLPSPEPHISVIGTIMYLGGQARNSRTMQFSKQCLLFIHLFIK